MARGPVAAEAIETATGAVGRYLLLISLTNLAFGIAIGIAAWLLGLPDAASGVHFLFCFASSLMWEP
jgi:predicted PurR-regulated permease PerM